MTLGMGFKVFVVRFKICIRGVGFEMRVGFYALRKLGFLTIEIEVYQNTVSIVLLIFKVSERYDNKNI